MVKSLDSNGLGDGGDGTVKQSKTFFFPLFDTGKHRELVVICLRTASGAFVRRRK